MKKMESIKITFLALIVLIVFCVIPSMAVDTGSISIVSTPPGAQIWIDGILQDHVTPHTFDSLSEWNLIRLHIDGYLDYKVINEEQTTIEAQLIPTPNPSMEITYGASNAPILPGDAFTFIVFLNPWVAAVGLDDFLASQYFWRSLDLTWDDRYLELWGADLCVNPIPGEDNSFTCEEPGLAGFGTVAPLEVRFLFHVLKSTPFRTTTIVNFISHFESRDPKVESEDLYESVPVYVPEYPSPVLPAIMIIGFLGAVLFIKRTKEH